MNDTLVAFLRADAIDNVAVFSPNDDSGARAALITTICAEQGYDGSAEVTAIDPLPGVGWVRQTDGSFLPPA